MFIGLISSTQESSAPISIPPINLSSSFPPPPPPPPPRIPSTNPTDLTQLRNTRHAVRGISRSLTQPRKSTHRQNHRNRPHDTTPPVEPKKSKSKKFLVIVTPHNESQGPLNVPRKGSPYYTTLENQGFIKPIEFKESSVDYCRKTILDHFADLPLTSFQFYRGDSRSSALTLSTLYNLENCDLAALKR
jgi:hypothetical protein